MKLSLINARNSDSPVTPYGLLTIAAVLEKHGHLVQVFDPFFGNKKFYKSLQDFNPDIIGISALTASYPQAKEIINDLRSILPQKKICMGGIHATSLPEKTLRDLPIDFVVLGEGEPVLLEICDRFTEIEDLNNYDGIAYLKAGEYFEKHRKALIKNLDELPFPAWHLLPIEKYLISPGYIRSHFLKRTLVVYSSRGCPNKCIFCASNKLFGYKVRRHSVHYFLNHIEYLFKTYHLDGLYIMDDTFTLNDKWLTEFCEGLKKRRLSFPWGCQGRVNTINEQNIVMLKNAGCIQIDFGVESGSQKVLDKIKKGIKVEDVLTAFSLCHKHGIRPYANIMVGNPDEKMEDVLLTEKLLKEIKPTFTGVGFAQPIPGSELYILAKENHWFDERDDFCGTLWDVRLAEEPIMAINMNRNELIKYRSRLQNIKFVDNYLAFITIKRLPFVLNVLISMLLKPKELFQIIKKYFRTRRLDELTDFALKEYRLRMMKRRVNSLSEL